MSKYPKSWQVGGHPVAEAKVRQLKKHDSPWLRAAGAGWVAEKQGPRSNVKVQGGGAWFCVGYETPSDLSEGVVMRSTNYDRLFIKAGVQDYALEAIADPGSAGTMPIRAVSPASTLSGWWLTFTERIEGLRFRFSLRSSLFGGTWRERLSVIASVDEYRRKVASIAGGTVAREDGTVARGFLNLWYGLQQPAGYISNDGGKSWSYIEFGKPEFIQGVPGLSLVAPMLAFAIVPVYVYWRPSSPLPNNTSARESYLCTIDLESAAVDEIPAGDLLDLDEALFPDFGAVVSLIPSEDEVNARLATLADQVSMVRLVTGEVMAVAPARYYDADGAANFRVALFIGTAAGGFARIGEINGTARSCYGFPTPLMLVGETPVMKLLPDNVEGQAEPFEPPRLVVWAPDGRSFTTKALPFPQHLCGELTVIGPSEFGITAYTIEEEVGAYRFFTTRDFGDTWVPKSTINKDAPSPSDVSENQMINFSKVTYVRDEDGRPANLTPGARWQSDGRLTPPWEE